MSGFAPLLGEKQTSGAPTPSGQLYEYAPEVLGSGVRSRLGLLASQACRYSLAGTVRRYATIASWSSCVIVA